MHPFKCQSANAVVQDIKDSQQTLPKMVLWMIAKTGSLCIKTFPAANKSEEYREKFVLRTQKRVQNVPPT